MTAPDRRGVLKSRPGSFRGLVRGDQAVAAEFIWQHPEDGVWTSEIPGRPGDLLVVIQISRVCFQPEVRGPAVLRGANMRTLEEAQDWCQRRVEK